MPTAFTTTRRVEFSDTDLAGIVHFSRFFGYMESAEHEFLRSLDTSVMAEHDGQKIGWPRVSASCDFRAPAFFEDELDIRLEVTRKGERSMTFGYTFTREGILIAEGQITTACCVVEPGGKMKAVGIPEAVAAKIEDTDSGSQE